MPISDERVPSEEDLKILSLWREWSKGYYGVLFAQPNPIVVEQFRRWLSGERDHWIRKHRLEDYEWEMLDEYFTQKEQDGAI